MDILKDFVMPATATTKASKDSKYFTQVHVDTLLKLDIKAAFIIPFMEDKTAKHQRKTVKDRIAVELANYPEQAAKQFIVGIVDGKGIAVQRITDKPAEKPADEQPGEQPGDEQPGEQPGE